MAEHPVLIAGEWRKAQSRRSFRSENPALGEKLPGEYPISDWADCDAALAAATTAAAVLRASPPERIAAFLDAYAGRIEARKAELVEVAHAETGLPKAPRLADVELPRTTGQLRQAAAAAREGSWALPTIDTKLDIRSAFAAIGPVWVFGPNNFPFAFNSVAGGDFAAALAAGDPVIAKANSSHPGTTRLLAEEAHAAAGEAGLPPGTVQLIYRTSHEDGERLVSDPRTGATGYTGSRSAGLKLKAAADAAGQADLPGAVGREPGADAAGRARRARGCARRRVRRQQPDGDGQFCTNPSLVLLVAGEAAEQFIAGVQARFDAAAPTPLLSSSVLRSLGESVSTLQAAGASVVTGGAPATPGYRFRNTLLRVSGDAFLAAPEKLQTEAFGNAALFVVARDAGQLAGAGRDARGKPDRRLLHRRARLGRRALRKARAAAAPARRPPAERQDAHRRRGQRRHEPRGPVSVDGPPGLHRGRHPRGAAAFRDAAVLRQRASRSRLPALLRDQPPNDKVFRLIDGEWRRGPVTGA